MAINARLEELKKKFDENPRRYFATLANEYRKQGDLTQAIALCRAHLPNQPGHISGHIVLAQALFEARELNEARQIFEQALELDPENLIALRTLGDIANSQGEILAARSWYERVLEADPRNDEIASLLREIAAAAAAVPAAPFSDQPEHVSVTTFDVHQGDAEASPLQAPPDADSSWDPDKTPVSNVAISDSAAPLMDVAQSAEEPSDIFGDGVQDQGAELLSGFQQVSEIEPEVMDAASPVLIAADEFESIEELRSDESSTSGLASSDDAGQDHSEAEDEFQVESFASGAFVPPIESAPTTELVVPDPEPINAQPESHGDSTVLETVAEFEEDADAFAVAQTMSDPEAHPAHSDDWFSAPTPPRGTVEISEFPEAVAVSALQETPEPAVAERQPESVDFAAFDLVETSRGAEPDASPAYSYDSDTVAADQGAAADEVEEYAGWFDEPAPDASSVVEAVNVVETVEVQESPQPEAIAEQPELIAAEIEPAEQQPAFVAADLPPQVDVEAESEPESIDRGFTGVDESSEAGEPVSASSLAEPVWGRTVEISEEPEGALPEMFMTETMAELYLQQGFTDEALQVYRKLLDRNPSDEALRSRIVSLESGAPSSVAEATSAAQAIDRAGRSVRSFFGRIARRQPARRASRSALDVESLGAQLANRQGGQEVSGERSQSPTLSELFSGAERHEDDDAAAQRLSSAFGPTESGGRPTRAADSELSLDHLFRDVPPESSSAVTLDAFFAATGGDTSDASPPTAMHGDEERTGDIEQFTAWLEGLKKK